MKSSRTKFLEVLLILGGIAVVLVAAFVGPGCGTLMNHDQKKPVIYGGVREDLRYLPVSIVDLPCSIVGDRKSVV